MASMTKRLAIIANAAFASASADSKRADSVDSGKSVVTTDLLSVYIVIKKALDMMKQAKGLLNMNGKVDVPILNVYANGKAASPTTQLTMARAMNEV